MKFIIGIGNPGKEYEKTRHNVGFQVLDVLKTRKVHGAHLVKPQTYVNHTGDEILRLAQRYTLLPEDLLVVCDDVNLPLGAMRLRARGSAGGHKGLLSVIGALNTEGFPRLRVGVAAGAPPADWVRFVLENFSKSEEKMLAGIFKKAAHICEIWAKEGFQAAQDQLSKHGGAEGG